MSESKNKLPKLGVIVAIEMDSVLTKYGKPVETVEKYGRTIHIYENDSFTMYVADAGAGEISAATATQLLISEYGVDMILNFGVVGALTAEMAAAELCVVEKVIHYDFDTTGWLNLPRGQYPGQPSAFVETTPALVEKATAICPALRRVTCASADKFVDDPNAKAQLRTLYGADICEMEAAGIVLTCTRCGVPCLLIKAVSDSLIGGGKEFFAELQRVSAKCFDVADRIIRELYKA